MHLKKMLWFELLNMYLAVCIFFNAKNDILHDVFAGVE